MVVVTIYAGKHEAYFEDRGREVDSFYAVMNNELVACMHLFPSEDDYQAKAIELARLLKDQMNVTNFDIRNSYLFSRDKKAAVRSEELEDGVGPVLGVTHDKLREFRKGLLFKLNGFQGIAND